MNELILDNLKVVIKEFQSISHCFRPGILAKLSYCAISMFNFKIYIPHLTLSLSRIYESPPQTSNERKNVIFVCILFKIIKYFDVSIMYYVNLVVESFAFIIQNLKFQKKKNINQSFRKQRRN